MNNARFVMHGIVLSVALTSVAFEDIFSGRCHVREAINNLHASYADVGRMSYPKRVETWNLPVLNLSTNGMTISVKPGILDDGQGILLFEGNGLLLDVRTKVCGSMREAHFALEEHFADMTIPRVWPCSTNDIGDLLFTRSHFGDSSAVFRRNNVFVAVRSWMPANSAADIASQIDSSILWASGIKPVGTVTSSSDAIQTMP